MTENKNAFKEILTGDEFWDDRFRNLEKYGKVNVFNGEFEFIKCDTCRSPWIAHENIEKSEVCSRIKRKGEKFSDEEVLEVEEWIKRIPTFEMSLAKIDKRQRACHCDDCEKTFQNRYAYENHLVLEHRMNGREIVKEEKSNDTTLVNILSSMEKLLNRTMDSRKPAQLIKPKVPPLWIGQDFEVFEKEIREWKEDSSDEEYEKYSKLIENL